MTLRPLRRRTRTRRARARIAALAVCIAAGPTACGADDAASSTAPSVSATSLTTTPLTTTTLTTTTSRVAPATSPRSTTPYARPTVDPYAGQPLIERVEWTKAEDGARLLVFPTRAGRDTTFPGAEQRAWTEILGHSPAADSPGMYDQFVCHWHWARLVQPDKPSWNLEPWRPDVGYEGTVAASCNPGGPER